MAVAYTSDVDKTPATGVSFTYTSFAVSGTNPVVIVTIAYLDDTGHNVTVSSVAVSAGLSAGTPVQIKTERVTVQTVGSIWAIPAPSGTGTITVTFSESVAWQSNAILLSGADQTTPCPAADAASTQGATNPLSVTPANLTASDAVVGLAANAGAGDDPGWDVGVETFYNNGTLVNMAAGYHLGTGAVTATWGSPVSQDLLVAVRVAAAAAAGGTPFFTRLHAQRI